MPGLAASFEQMHMESLNKSGNMSAVFTVCHVMYLSKGSKCCPM